MIVRDKPIRLARITEVARVQTLPAAYSYRADRKYKWLQRLCLWALRRLGCHARLETSKIEVEHVSYDDLDELFEALYDQHAELRYLFGCKRGHIFIGPGLWREAMGLKAEWECASALQDFRCRARAILRGTPHEADIGITIIPWMEGVLIVPEDRVRSVCQ